MPSYNANWIYENILKQIQAFEAQLDENSEVGLRFASFGGTTTMKVEKIGYQNPHLLYFRGKVRGDDALLIQHTSQLSFLMVAEKKQDPTLPATRLGFACGVGEI